MSKKKYKRFLSFALVLSFFVWLYWPFKASESSLFPDSIVFAHRGYTENAPENTPLAFKQADSLNFQALETDIQQTKDGHLVVFHDDNAKRLLGIDEEIKNMTLDFLKQQATLVTEKSEPQPVLSLREFFHAYGHKFILYLDIKNVTEGVSDSLISLIHEFQLEKQVMVADADIFFLLDFKQSSPKIPTVLEGFNSDKLWLPTIIPPRIAPDYYAGFISKIDSTASQRLKEKGLLNKYIAYDVNKVNLPKAQKWGLKHIILDYETNMGSISKILR